MKQTAAPVSLSIKIVTSAVLLLTLGLCAAVYFYPDVVWPAIILALIDLYCFASAPVAYELKGNSLTVHSRVGKKLFGPVVKCSLAPDEKPPFTVRIWGNGGLFAGTGFFWNRKYGLFRAYVTSGDKSKLTLVETPGVKIIITPDNPGAFITAVDFRDEAKYSGD